MKDQFTKVTNLAKSEGLDAKTIIKVLVLIDKAMDENVELYVESDRLRMRYIGYVNKGNTNIKDDDLFGNLKDLFGMK